MARPMVLALALMATAATAQAQERERERQEPPEGFRPPPGMCRIWLPGVPAGQQPAPTDCATALRRRPAEGRVIFGESRAPSAPAPRAVRGRSLAPDRERGEEARPAPETPRPAPRAEREPDRARERASERRPARPESRTPASERGRTRPPG